MRLYAQIILNPIIVEQNLKAGIHLYTTHTYPCIVKSKENNKLHF